MDANRVITPNQLVAYNLRRARELRGWTQVEAAKQCAPYLGAEWSRVVWSAAEHSIDGRRIRQFTADDLFAFALGFDLPVAYFLLAPDEYDGSGFRYAVAAGPTTNDEPQAPLERLEPLEPPAAIERVLYRSRELMAVALDKVFQPAGFLGTGVTPWQQHAAMLVASRMAKAMSETFGDLEAWEQRLTEAADGFRRVREYLEPGNATTGSDEEQNDE